MAWSLLGLGRAKRARLVKYFTGEPRAVRDRLYVVWNAADDKPIVRPVTSNPIGNAADLLYI